MEVIVTEAVHRRQALREEMGDEIQVGAYEGWRKRLPWLTNSGPSAYAA